MKIIISGYGRMGQQIEKMALQRGHKIMAIIEQPTDFEIYKTQLSAADVAIDFSLPESAVQNILRFFDADIPVVVGTTGWYEQFETIQKQCVEKKQSLLYGTNMSLGMNLFFLLNQQLAKLMQPYAQYRPSLEETHHIHKKDVPSGTAITLAEDILKQYSDFQGWGLTTDNISEKLPITAIREGEIVGNHKVTYRSDFDEIEISHVAFQREGFALGAVLAAEWLPGRYGVFTMKDVINAKMNDEQ